MLRAYRHSIDIAVALLTTLEISRTAMLRYVFLLLRVLIRSWSLARDVGRHAAGPHATAMLRQFSQR